MAEEPKTGLSALLLAKVVCCGGLILVATGGLSGLGLWLADGWAVWIGGALAASAVAAVIWRRHRAR